MDKSVIAKRLIAARGKTTRKEAAKRLGISISALSMYENGHRIPSDENKRKIAEIYGKSIEDLFFAF